jgi:hypothetical protein
MVIRLFTVPPYAVAFVTMYLLSSVTCTRFRIQHFTTDLTLQASDRTRKRGPFVATVFILSLIGWIILLTVLHNNHARYFGCILIVIGGYCAIPLIMSWVGE